MVKYEVEWLSEQGGHVTVRSEELEISQDDDPWTYTFDGDYYFLEMLSVRKLM